jgi:hypothetical protein
MGIRTNSQGNQETRERLRILQSEVEEIRDLLPNTYEIEDHFAARLEEIYGKLEDINTMVCATVMAITEAQPAEVESVIENEIKAYQEWRDGGERFEGPDDQAEDVEMAEEF